MSDKLLNKLAEFLQLEREFRQSDNSQALDFVAANLTHNVIRYDTAIVLRSDWNLLARSPEISVEEQRLSQDVKAVSGASSFDADAPLLSMVCAGINTDRENDRKQPYTLVLNTEDDKNADQQNAADESSRSYLLVCELHCAQCLLGSLVLHKQLPWQDYEMAMAAQVQHALAHSYLVHFQHCVKQGPTVFQRAAQKIKKTKLAWAIAASLLIALFPVRQSVIAQGQIVASAPAVVASGLNGVVEDVLVQPNQIVEQGELLFRLDATELLHRKNRIQQELELASERLRKAEQQSFGVQQNNTSSSSMFAELRAESELKILELEYVQGLMQRLEVRASVGGVVLFSSRRDWLGRAVSTGEKIMELAEQDDQQFEIWLDVNDAIALNSGDEVKFFPDAFPLSSVSGAVKSVAYFANETSDKLMAYRITATMDGEDRTRLGMKGTARLYGQRIVFAYYLLRKPLSSVRKFLAL